MSQKLNSKNSGNSGSIYTEDWLTINQIMNGMIQLNTGEYVTGVKISPKNIFILEQAMQRNIINKLENFYNAFEYEFWLIIADRPVDISLYLSKLQLMYNNTTSQVQRKLILDDITKGNLFMSAEYNVVDTEYYILFKEKRMEIVQKKMHNIISNLANSGLQSKQTSNEDLRMILDNFLNDGQQTIFGTVM
ncbi:MAG: hypothetical protein R3Y13_04870 [bacterium]